MMMSKNKRYKGVYVCYFTLIIRSFFRATKISEMKLINQKVATKSSDFCVESVF